MKKIYINVIFVLMLSAPMFSINSLLVHYGEYSNSVDLPIESSDLVNVGNEFNSNEISSIFLPPLPIRVGPIVLSGEHQKKGSFDRLIGDGNFSNSNLIVDGTIKLYAVHEEQHERIFAKKGSQSPIELKLFAIETYKKIKREDDCRAILIELMSDNESMWKAVMQSTLNKEEVIDILNSYNHPDQAALFKIEPARLKKIFTQSGMFNISKDIPKGSQIDFNYGINRELMLVNPNSSDHFSAHFGFRYKRMGYNQLYNAQDAEQQNKLSINEPLNSDQTVSKRIFSSLRETTIGLPVYLRFHNRNKAISFISEIGTIVGSTKTTQSIKNDDISTTWDLSAELIVGMGVALNISKNMFLATIYDLTQGLMIKAETRF